MRALLAGGSPGSNLTAALSWCIAIAVVDFLAAAALFSAAHAAVDPATRDQALASQVVRSKGRDIARPQLRLRCSGRIESGDSVIIDALADGPTLRQTSYAVIFPVAGVLLLAFGIRRRLAWRRWNRSDNDRLLSSTQATAAPVSDSGLRSDLWDRSQRPGRGTGLIVGGVIVTLLGVGHVLSYVATAHVAGAVKADVGQCLTAADFEQRDIGAEPVDCDRTDATVQLVSKGDGEATCPDGERDGSLYPVLKGVKHTVCFTWNLREGHCYVSAPGDVTPTDCTSPAANVKVAFRVDGPGGATGCPAGGEALTYHEPKLSYCLVKP